MFPAGPSSSDSGAPSLLSSGGATAKAPIRSEEANHLAYGPAMGCPSRHARTSGRALSAVPSAMPAAKCSVEWAISGFPP